MDNRAPAIADEADARHLAAVRDADLVDAARVGDPDAFGKLYDEWFDHVHDVASHITRDREAAAEVAQDTFLSAWRNLANLADPMAFGGWLLRIARNTALNRSRKEARSRPVDDEGLAAVEASGPSPAMAPAGFRVEDRLAAVDEVAAAAESAELSTMVWEAAGALGDRDASLLDLHLRHGLGPAEIAEVMGVTRNNANQLLHRLRARLGAAVRARVLWRGGEPACPGLAEALADARVERFGADAVGVITRHVMDCEQCEEAQRTRLAPAVLFSAMPLAVAPALLKAKAAAALGAQGVPMSGSAAATGSGFTGAAGMGAAGMGAAGAGAAGAGGASLVSGTGVGDGPASAGAASSVDDMATDPLGQSTVAEAATVAAIGAATVAVDLSLPPPAPPAGATAGARGLLARLRLDDVPPERFVVIGAVAAGVLVIIGLFAIFASGSGKGPAVVSTSRPSSTTTTLPVVTTLPPTTVAPATTSAPPTTARKSTPTTTHAPATTRAPVTTRPPPTTTTTAPPPTTAPPTTTTTTTQPCPPGVQC